MTVTLSAILVSIYKPILFGIVAGGVMMAKAALGMRCLKLVVASRIHSQLQLVEMDDVGHGFVERFAVVTDDDEGMRVADKIILQPHNSLKV